MADTNGTNGASANGFVKKPAVDVPVALAPNNLPAAAGLLKDISSLGPATLDGDEKSRLDLAEKARALVRSLETPRETMVKHCYSQHGAFMALTVGIESGLFTALAEDGGCPKTAQDLAQRIDANPDMISRIMRHIGAMGYIEETAPDTYKPTNFTSALTIPMFGAGYSCISGGLVGALSKFPEWLRKEGYQAKGSVTDGPLQYAYQTDKDMFAHLMENAAYGQQFHQHMGGVNQGRASWLDFYPVQERLVDGFDGSPDAVMLVDVGGGYGHDLDAFRRRNIDAPGRLVLEDLGVALGQITDLHPKIERLEHDFFTEQPIKGARAYYMHKICHDWHDEVAAKILTRIKEAMRPGYSRLLINENVIPPQRAHWEDTGLDMMMMTLLTSRERTQGNWERLVQGLAGLRIAGIYTAGNGESIVECELAE